MPPPLAATIIVGILVAVLTAALRPAGRGPVLAVLVGVEIPAVVLTGWMTVAPEVGWDHAGRVVLAPLGGAALAGWLGGLALAALLARRARRRDAS
jgi:hypothetical protein